ncbi:MAG: enoyl-CoA hydratase/isomerase family protein [Deltaproteobacteria bacterium]|nr:enoyl-CoA hydratase/isomerase family protein [Deltaproteobacteria bacterium]
MAIEIRDLDGGVRIMQLNRPPANAINSELMNALENACAAAARDPAVRAVVVTGSGKFFCGGLDLRALTGSPQEGRQLSAFGRNDGVFALWTLPKPTIAMVNGHAIAGGGILTLACDVRIGAHGNAKIGLNETAIGLPLPAGALAITGLALTNQQARRVCLEAELYPPTVARELGILDEVVEPAKLEEACLAKARLLAAYPQAAYAYNKRALQHDAVQLVLNETDEQRRAAFAVWTSPETVQKLNQQLSGISSKGK